MSSGTDDASEARRPPDIVISIVNHSNPDLLADCLRSLHESLRGVSCEVWVVDNATDRRGLDRMRADFPQVRWLFNESRRGFSANHNQVLSRGVGRYYCILNDDTLIHPGMFEELVEFLDDNPGVGMAGPRTLNRDGTIQASTFRFMPAWFQVVEQCLLPPPLVGMKRWGVDQAHVGDRACPVDWLLGACLVIRREALEQVGPLDDRLAPVGNMEDVDWCRRVRDAGWGVWFVPAARMTHYGGQSFWTHRAGADGMRVEMMRANLRYHRKHGGWAAAAFVSLVYLLALPWNVLMLSQMAIRRRLRWTIALGQMRTALGIAHAGIIYLLGADRHRHPGPSHDAPAIR